MGVDWTAVSGLATAIAAFFAGCQIWYSRRDANNRVVFEHLREIDNRIQQAWSVPSEVAQDEIIDYYRKKRKDLTPGGKQYMALLNSLDILAFAVHKRLVSEKPINQYVKTLVSPNVLSLTFLKELRKCCGEDASYEHLYEYFTKLRDVERQKKLKGA